MDAKTNNTQELKRTHKKPYKVGRLYFGRKSTLRGAGWIVSASEDLSNPIANFEVGKQARFFCEDVRDEEKAKKANANTSSSAEVDVNIPAGTGLTNIFDEVTDTEIV
tara:strand:- start:313 stop:636 length:324 start_codon:yes stop_codon:yes gene_type:complete